MSRIIIVSGIQLSTNPRVVKEADALADAGHDVTVIGAALNPAFSLRDAELHAGKRWAYENLLDSADRSARGRLKWLVARCRMRFWREMGRRLGIADVRQLGYVASEMLSYCLSNPAELYILHHPQSMWVGVELIRRRRKVAADIEDWYSQDSTWDNRLEIPVELLREWERIVLNSAVYATTTSRALSEALASEYHCTPPTVVYNAFSLAERNTIDGKFLDRRDTRLPSCIWFSQVIGPGRGLEALMDSLNAVLVPFAIHLRGDCDPAFASSLLSRAPEEWRGRIFIHPQVPHMELASRLAEHDFAYAGELPQCASRDLTITNKILHYLLAGLPVIASNTQGHAEVSGKAEKAVALFAAGDPQALAVALNELLLNAGTLPLAREDAVTSAERYFCWEKVRPELLHAVETHFPVRQDHISSVN